MICTANPMLFGLPNRDEMGGACRTYGEEKRCIQGFGGET